MAKTYVWEFKEEIRNENDGEGAEEILHTVKLTCSMLLGKAVITIDGDEYDISTKPFALRGTEQMFRLGELPAVVEFPRNGEPVVKVNGEALKRLSA